MPTYTRGNRNINIDRFDAAQRNALDVGVAVILYVRSECRDWGRHLGVHYFGYLAAFSTIRVLKKIININAVNKNALQASKDRGGDSSERAIVVAVAIVPNVCSRM